MNKEKYEELCSQVYNSKIDLWYLKTEPIFKKQEVNTEEDFIRLVAYTYSWMPTIPVWNHELNWPSCLSAIKKLKNREPGSLKLVLFLIVPTINNSIVGASKVLHFIYPDIVPIIDSNVIVGWRALFFPSGLKNTASSKVARLPSNFGSYGSNTKMREKHINLYIEYSENLLSWAAMLHEVSIRDIESKLYLLGKQITANSKKLTNVST